MPTRNAVCLCTDRNTLIPALFVADAVKSSAKDPLNAFDVIIFIERSDVTEAAEQWMEARGIVLCDNLDMAPLRRIAKFEQRLSAATLIKLVVAEHLAARYDKILYLDTDVTIHNDVSAIFSLDTGEFAVAAVGTGWRWPSTVDTARQALFRDHVRALGMTEPFRFINTGVLLIDVFKWNRAEVGARALDFIRRNQDLCFLPDEHGLNAVLDGRQAEISPPWNMQPPLLQSAMVRHTAEPIIVHYVGADKPWKKYGYGKRIRQNLPANRLYDAFVRNSPWPDWLDAQWTYGDFRKNVVYELRLISRRLRRAPSAPLSRRQLRIEAGNFCHYCLETPFADVTQGIVIREAGMLRLSKSHAVPA